MYICFIQLYFKVFVSYVKSTHKADFFKYFKMLIYTNFNCLFYFFKNSVKFTYRKIFRFVLLMVKIYIIYTFRLKTQVTRNKMYTWIKNKRNMK